MAELEAATAAYEDQLTAPGAAWLLARGLDQATAAGHRLGVVADPFPGHERFTGFLAIPYLNAAGAPLSMRFRCLAEHNHREHGHGKYMSMTDEPARVFNIGSIVNNDGDDLHISEGEFDAMVLTMCGFPAIAIPGAQAWRTHHRHMVAGFSNVFVWGDPDEAGAEFNQKVTNALTTARSVRMRREDGDVSELYKVGGVAALAARLAGEV